MRFFVFFLLFLVQGTLYSQKEIIADSVIVWHPSKQLMWEDFQGNGGENTFATASTSYKIVILPETVLVDENDKIQGYQDLTAHAQFYKTVSWTSTQNNQVLRHERLHFDIAELFARKVRKRFSELKTEREARFSVYYSEYNIIWKECRAFQQRYDSETNHGRNLKENEAWIQSVVEALVEFQEYQ